MQEKIQLNRHIDFILLAFDVRIQNEKERAPSLRQEAKSGKVNAFITLSKTYAKVSSRRGSFRSEGMRKLKIKGGGSHRKSLGMLKTFHFGANLGKCKVLVPIALPDAFEAYLPWSRDSLLNILRTRSIPLHLLICLTS